MRYSLHVCVHLHLSDSASVRACSGHSYPFHLGSKTQRRVFLINAVCASRRARRQTHKTSGAQSGANAMNISRSFTAVPSSRGSRQLRISSRSPVLRFHRGVAQSAPGLQPREDSRRMRRERQNRDAKCFLRNENAVLTWDTLICRCASIVTELRAVELFFF